MSNYVKSQNSPMYLHKAQNPRARHIYDVSYLQTLLTHRNEKLRMTFKISRHTTLIVKNVIELRLSNYNRKNNQPLVPDADREVPTFGSTDNAGNSAKKESASSESRTRDR